MFLLHTIEHRQLHIEGVAHLAELATGKVRGNALLRWADCRRWKAQQLEEEETKQGADGSSLHQQLEWESGALENMEVPNRTCCI